MAQTFEKTITAISAGAAGTVAVEVKVPYAGIINRIVVNQSAGTKSGYTLAIYNKLEYAGSTIEYVSGTDISPGTQSIIGKVAPTLTVGAGVDFEQVFDISYPYRNQDARVRNVQPGVLHVFIDTAAANDDEVFELTIAGVVADE